MQTSTQIAAEPTSAGTISSRPSSNLAYGLALLAILLRLWFWFYTGRTWEDALITLQHAENAVRGFGLTHDAGGPRVHGFTSPISVLIPLAGELLHRGFGLPLLKITSVIAGGISAFLGVRIAGKLHLGTSLALLVGGYLALEHQQILFGMAGMETQVVVAILLFSIYILFDPRPVWIGAALGLCMLARPDFLFWVFIVLGLLTWQCWREGRFRPLAVSLCVLTSVYGPWVAFTTLYYGSPIPNTIWAKEFGYPNRWFAGLSPYMFAATLLHRLRHIVFAGLGPAYAGNGTGFERFADRGLICVVMLLFLLPCVWIVWKRKDLPSLAIVSFVAVYAFYYLFLMGFVFGWYTVPLAAVTVIAGAIGIDAVLHELGETYRERAGYALAIAYLACLAAILPATFRGDKRVQQYVEEGIRKPMALYLGQVMSPNQTIGSESLGYVGYYSRRAVYDYPGLANPNVVQFERENPRKTTFSDIFEHFRPDYLVLRPADYSRPATKKWLQRNYVLVKDYRVSDANIRQMLFPAENVDLEFLVLRRKDAS